MKKLFLTAILFIAATVVIVSCKKEQATTHKPVFTGFNNTAKDTPWVTGSNEISDTPWVSGSTSVMDTPYIKK